MPDDQPEQPQIDVSTRHPSKSEQVTLFLIRLFFRAIWVGVLAVVATASVVLTLQHFGIVPL